MEKANLKLNYLYNLSFQLFAMITPLITTPYVSRVLSPEGIGKFSFVASVNSYFCMLAALGFSFHAQREIAKNQGNIQKQSIVFWEIVFCKVITGIISFVFYEILISSGIFGDYVVLMKIMAFEIVSTSLNIAFFFQGNENFRLIAFRDFIIRVIGVLLIFSFVNEQEDLWIYALCHVGSSLLSVFSLWPCLKKRIVFIKISQLNPQKQFLPSLKLFVPTITISLFTLLDKVLIGVLIPGTIETYLPDGTLLVKHIADVENGYYAQSEKIVKMTMMVFASLGAIMMPRNSKELEEGHKDVFLKNINKAIDFVFFAGSPIAAGISAIAFSFSPWFFGIGYDKVPVLIMIFATMILPAGLGNVLGQQYLIPKGEDEKYIVTYLSTGILNLCLNLLLIPRLLSYGAAIATVIAETFAPLLMLVFLRESISFSKIIKNNWKPLVSATVMFVFVYITSLFLSSSIFNTAVLIFEGIGIYVTLVLIFKYRMACEEVDKIKLKIMGRKNT